MIFPFSVALQRFQIDRMRRLAVLALAVLASLGSNAQIINTKPVLTGMYLQWGYNRDVFSRSTLHFMNGSTYDFKVHRVKAKDKPDFSGFWTNPLDITIPQNSFRIGFFLNKKKTHSIELNYDHTKYVVTDGQPYTITGQIHGQEINWRDTMLSPGFLHVEHTNGANFWMINYVGHHEVLRNKKKDFRRASLLYKAGAGLVVPRSDIYFMGKRLDNEFHVAGYVLGLEGGARFYPVRNFFLEINVKGGFANYLNVLTVGDGGRIRHNFWYGEVIGLLGYDINFDKSAKRKPRGSATIEKP